MNQRWKLLTAAAALACGACSSSRHEFIDARGEWLEPHEGASPARDGSFDPREEGWRERDGAPPQWAAGAYEPGTLEIAGVSFDPNSAYGVDYPVYGGLTTLAGGVGSGEFCPPSGPRELVVVNAPAHVAARSFYSRSTLTRSYRGLSPAPIGPARCDQRDVGVAVRFGPDDFPNSQRRTLRGDGRSYPAPADRGTRFGRYHPGPGERGQTFGRYNVGGTGRGVHLGSPSYPRYGGAISGAPRQSWNTLQYAPQYLGRPVTTPQCGPTGAIRQPNVREHRGVSVSPSALPPRRVGSASRRP